MNLILKSLSAPSPNIPLVLTKHKEPFCSYLYLTIFSTPHSPPPLPTTLISRGTNTLNHPKAKVPSPPAHSQNSANASTPNPPTEKEKNQTGHWCQNLRLRSIALHMCYYWNLSEQTQFSNRTGVICEVVTPQTQGKFWSSTLAMFLLTLRTAGLLNMKIEWANTICI